jgi:apolipoprotein N-acyltransferase
MPRQSLTGRSPGTGVRSGTIAGMVDDVLAGPATSRDTGPVAAEAEPIRHGRRRLAGAWSVAAAIAAGLVMYVAFPPFDLWFMAPAGVALLGLATYRRGFWTGAGLGLVTGISLLLPLLGWAGGYVGNVWLILPAGESAYFAVLGGLSAVVSPVLSRWRWSWPLVTGALWVLQEALRDRVPFGGFPWGRLAFSQGGSPLLRLAELGGAPLVTFGVAAIGGLIAWAALAVMPAPGGRLGRGALLPVGLAIALAWVPLAVPAAAGDPVTPVTVAVIQGNVPRLGLDFNAQREAVLNNHVEATLQLAADVKAGRTARPDLVVWPENASDVDPIANADASARLDEAATAIGVPILVGGLLDGPGPHQVRNVGIVWNPSTGAGEIYSKRHPVPFAEYVPLRSFARLLTDKVDLVRSDFVAGDRPGVLTVGPATVGDVICFEVAYDDVVRDTVTGGAQLLVVQTNNATFNPAEAAQQLAMVRLRAVEHGRPALMASTVGISGFVDPDGSVHDATSFDQRAIIIRELRLRTGRTIATDVGEAPELALLAVALAAVVVAIAIRRRKVEG